jgi:hypothetical protein
MRWSAARRRGEDVRRSSSDDESISLGTCWSAARRRGVVVVSSGSCAAGPREFSPRALAQPVPPSLVESPPPPGSPLCDSTLFCARTAVTPPTARVPGRSGSFFPKSHLGPRGRTQGRRRVRATRGIGSTPRAGRLAGADGVPEGNGSATYRRRAASMSWRSMLAPLTLCRIF